MSTGSRKQPASAKCQICENAPFKYSCPACRIVYCSLGCFKDHKANSCTGTTQVKSANTVTLESGEPPNAAETRPEASRQPDGALAEPPTLKPLTSLRWPYVPEEPSYPDPLAKEEAKPLQLPQYEAIATSTKIRALLENNPRIKPLLRSLDTLQGNDREWELEKVLGVAVDAQGRVVKGDAEDMAALRELAEAIEEVVRRPQDCTQVGLDWGDSP